MQIIKEWTHELQERTSKFRKQAEALGEWDRRIITNRNLLIKLESEVAKVVESQHSLERQLELIETHQQEVISLSCHRFYCLSVPCFESHELFVRGEMSYFSFLCVFIGQIEKSLESMEDEAERIYRDERPTLVEDEAAATRDMM
jgi:nuclear pore complex protein Nup62